MNQKEQRKIQITIKGYEIAKVENATALIFKKLSYAGVKTASGKIFLPNKRERWTVLKSPRGHKNAQQNLGRVTHRRLIEVSDINLVDLNKIGLTGSYPEFPRDVLINIKV